MRLHTNGYDERAERLSFPRVGEGDGVDRRPRDASKFKLVADVRTNKAPSGLDGMTVNRAELVDDTIGFRGPDLKTQGVP